MRIFPLPLLCLMSLSILAGLQAGRAFGEEAPDARGEPEAEEREPRAGVLDGLDLTPEQKQQVILLLRKHKGRFRSPEFLEDLRSVLTAEQRARLRGGRDEEDDEETAGGETPPGLPAPRAWKNLPYAGEGSLALQRLDVYAPGEAEKLPVVIFVHGGGWRKGDKSSAAGKGAFFASKGYVFVSVNYRLSPAVVHPEHVRDVAKAVAWVVKNIGEYGGDPSRLAIMGHSAGAHLAALAAADEGRLKEAGLEGVGLFSGAILLDGAGYEIRRQVEELGNAMNSALYRSAFTADPEVWDDASPVLHAKAGRGFAPYLIFHVADREASRLQSESLAAALRASGGQAKVYAARGKTHGTLNQHIGRKGDDVTAEILRFLEAVTAGKEPFGGAAGQAPPAAGPEGDAAARARLERARRLIASKDSEGDGKLSRAEWPAGQLREFDRADVNGDGFVDPAELAERLK